MGGNFHSWRWKPPLPPPTATATSSPSPQTLGGGFGSGAAVGGTGVFLNNMASHFELEEGSPNRIGPGKRVDFVVAPTQILLSAVYSDHHLVARGPGLFLYRPRERVPDSGRVVDRDRQRQRPILRDEIKMVARERNRQGELDL